MRISKFEHLRTGLRLSCLAGAVAIGMFASTQSHAGSIIFNSLDPAFQTVALGVNDEGHLNFNGGLTSNAGGFTGLAARFPDGTWRDATAPGCLCEGWGVAVTSGGSREAGFANVAAGNGGLTGGTFGATTTAATSVISLANAPIQVTHAYGVSLAPGVFQGNVTITNTGDTAVEDVVYRRAMDWDVPPTEFSEYVSHYGVTANLEANGGNVRYASDNGFASSDPRSSAFGSGVNTDFVDMGPADHGSVFDFAFGGLAAGESRSFNIFYGVAANESLADAAINILNPNVWSYGQSNAGGGEAADDNFTFIFAFGGVGGVEPGMNPSVPVLPFVIAPGQFFFDAPTPRRWFDPPFADGFEYEIDGAGEFFSFKIAPGFGTLTLEVGGVSYGPVTEGTEYNFLTDFGLDDISVFRLLGIDPDLDIADPGFATAFPTFLDFTDGVDFFMSAIVNDTPPSVPEPASLGLLTLGFSVMMWRRRRSV
jgi:hypothetical protein